MFVVGVLRPFWVVVVACVVILIGLGFSETGIHDTRVVARQQLANWGCSRNDIEREVTIDQQLFVRK